MSTVLDAMLVVDRCIVLVERHPRSKWRTVVCCGPRSHFRKTGSCRHTDLVVANLRPEFKKVVRVRPFGTQAEEKNSRTRTWP